MCTEMQIQLIISQIQLLWLWILVMNVSLKERSNYAYMLNYKYESTPKSRSENLVDNFLVQ